MLCLKFVLLPTQAMVILNGKCCFVFCLPVLCLKSPLLVAVRICYWAGVSLLLAWELYNNDVASSSSVRRRYGPTPSQQEISESNLPSTRVRTSLSTPKERNFGSVLSGSFSARDCDKFCKVFALCILWLHCSSLMMVVC